MASMTWRTFFLQSDGDRKARPGPAAGRDDAALVEAGVRPHGQAASSAGVAQSPEGLGQEAANAAGGVGIAAAQAAMHDFAAARYGGN
jgi:hypothetical protein